MEQLTSKLLKKELPNIRYFNSNLLLHFLISVPSQPPSNLTAVASTSTSIIASWQLPPECGRSGNITGFKLFYKKKGSGDSPTILTNNVTSLTRVVSGLDKYTEYEFQVLAVTSNGDGQKSSIRITRTDEDGKRKGLLANDLHKLLDGPKSYSTCS